MATESLKLGRAWDEEFNGWTEELLLGRKLKKARQASTGKSSWTGADLGTQSPPDYPGKGSKASPVPSARSRRTDGRARRSPF